jgi:hypothetical protein
LFLFVLFLCSCPARLAAEPAKRPSKKARPGASSKSPVSILAYEAGSRDGSAAPEVRRLEARFQITPQLTLVGATNPDAEIIDSDVPDLDFSYTEKLRGERRSFFRYGDDYFGSLSEGEGDSGARLFTPQRVPHFDTGFKLYGQMRPSSNLGVMALFSGSRRDTALQWRETLSPKASLSFGYVGRDDDRAHNRVWQMQGDAQSGGWEGRLSYARSQDKKGDGDRWDVSGGYKKNGFRARLHYGQTSPEFVARNGLVPYTDVRELSGQLSYGCQWQTGAVRQLSVFTGAYEATRLDNAFYRRYQTHGLTTRMASGLSLRLNYRTERFQRHHDHVTSVGLIFPGAGPFATLGVRYGLGTRRGSAYRFFAPVVSCRLGPKLTAGLSSQTVRHTKNNELKTVSLNYDLGNRQSLGIRVEHRGSDTSWLLAYRQNAGRGL